MRVMSFTQPKSTKETSDVHFAGGHEFKQNSGDRVTDSVTRSPLKILKISLTMIAVILCIVPEF